jgi:hypothetical protein
MQNLEGSGTPVLYIGRTVLKGYGRGRILETERGTSKSHSMENSLSKKPWTCRKTDYRMNVLICLVQ